MHERRNIRLSAASRYKLEALVAPDKSIFWGAKITLLTADGGDGTAEIMQPTGKAGNRALAGPVPGLRRDGALARLRRGRRASPEVAMTLADRRRQQAIGPARPRRKRPGSVSVRCSI